MSRPVAVYLRVSSDDQNHASQRLEVDRWLAREGVDPARVGWYEEVMTGRKARRPALDRLRRDVQAGRVKTVVVYALDRLSRDFFDGIELLGVFLKRGARVASVTEPLDLSGELGQALAGVIFALASAEWRKRRDRQKAGIEVARAAGIYKGRKSGSTKARPARAAALRAQGLTVPEIGQALGVSEPTVYRYLAAPQR